MCVCEREREHITSRYLPYLHVPRCRIRFPFYLTGSFSQQADTNKSYAQKYFHLVFLADSKLHYPVPKVALHLDAFVRGKKREQYLYLGARPH